jgi:predicted RNA binding protein YcfA (HicA-like mRNA interferase family)
MGKRKYPPLTPSEVIAILTSLGFVKVRQDGSHAHYEHAPAGEYPRSIVTVDMAYSEFSDDLIKSMIRQSNRSREVFYGATKRTARQGIGATLQAYVRGSRLAQNLPQPATSAIAAWRGMEERRICLPVDFCWVLGA